MPGGCARIPREAPTLAGRGRRPVEVVITDAAVAAPARCWLESSLLRSTHLTALNASFDHIVGYIKANASADDDETSTVDPATISKRDGKKRARK